MSIIFYLFALFLSVLNSIESSRILAVFPVPSISHQVAFRPLTQELARRGHDVTVITPDPAFSKGETPPNLTEIDVHDISYTIWKENVVKAAKGNQNDILLQVEIILDTLAVVFDAQLQTEGVQEILSDKNKKFDLLILEACVRPALAFSYLFKIPVILISSFGTALGHYQLMGASEHPLLYPSVVRQRLHNLTMWEKIQELYNHYRTIKIFEMSERIETHVLKKNFGPDIPSVHELGINVDMILLNTNPVFYGINPVPPSVIYISGIHQNPVKPLPVDLKKYLDSSKNGVIYISFGTNVDSTLLPAERVQILVNVLSKLPYDVLFKWDNESLPGRTKNIRISKWLPQSDLLRHPNIKLFVTQGGLQSTDEAIGSGVPLIGIPMLADQWYNAEKYVYHKIGMKLDLETLTEDEFRNAIDTVIGDESYRRNIIRLRTLMMDQPITTLERAM